MPIKAKYEIWLFFTQFECKKRHRQLLEDAVVSVFKKKNNKEFNKKQKY